MHELQRTLLLLSGSGTLLIIMLLLCQPLYKERFSRRWQYYIWLVVAARFLIPWTPLPSPIGTVFQKAAQQIEQTNVPDMVQDMLQNSSKDKGKLQSAEPEVSANLEDTPKANIAPEHVKTQVSKSVQKFIPFFVQNMNFIWLVTALLLFIRKITIYQSFAKYISVGSIPVDDINLLEQMGTMIGQNHIKGTVGLSTNSLLASPLLIGFFHPRIVLPSLELSNADFHYTVLHELVHYKRMDILYKWLVQLVVCLHWFNPFVYLMEREISRACELACDEAVIRNLDAAARKEYGDTLLHAMGTAGAYKNSAASVSFIENKALLKGRLEAIMKYKKKSKTAQAAAFALTILFSISAASIGAYQIPAAVSSNSSAKQQDDYRIMYEDGIYYILDKGVSESDMPSGSITDGCVSIDFVEKDGYMGIGPIDDMEKLLEEITSECSYMLKHGGITQRKADIFIDAAREIQDAYKPNKSGLIKLNKKSITLVKGSTAALKLIGTNKKAAWSSGNKKVAAVNKSGTVSAKQAGTTNIFAQIGRITYACKVKVKNAAASKTINTEEYASHRITKKAKTINTEEYASHGITKKDGAYYYQGKRVRMFMDVRADNSFVVFQYDKKGSIDLRLRRAENNSIVKVEYISKEEVEEMRNDMDIVDGSVSNQKTAKKQTTKQSTAKKQMTNPSIGITRLTKDEVPDSIAKAINSCDAKKWYVIHKGGKDYIFYGGLPHNYAFQPETSADGVKVKVFDMGSSSSQYVLLAVQSNVSFTIYYNNVRVSYKKITV